MEAFRPTPLEIICYHCQQASEKIIKAVYISLALPGGLPRKHDLTFLLEQMKNRVDVPESIFDHCDRLNSYGVIVRYPNEIQLDLHSVQQAIQYAEEIMDWGTSLLQQTGC